MNQSNNPHPPITNRDDWRKARIALLEREKAATRLKDKIASDRRRLPMVKVELDYKFESTNGMVSLRDLFGDSRQLIVYHFMFDPEWESGCLGCTSYIDALSIVDLEELSKRDTAFVIVSRAPLEKIVEYRKTRKWEFEWVSSFGSSFNYDFDVTQDASVKPVEYNYRDSDDQTKTGEAASTSVFFRIGDDIYHTYQTFARGNEGTSDSYGLLDLTPYGRQEDWEDSPEGWPQKPTYG